ncbi:MAG: hypothetical protein IIT53_07500, partial [Fibrobacter sp.]|nr:hypothetical protein [Fibrobacter sp.]
STKGDEPAQPAVDRAALFHGGFPADQHVLDALRRLQIAEIRPVDDRSRVKHGEIRFNEILVDRFAQLHIDKWKIFRQMPFNENKGVSDYQFYAFIKNNYREDLMRTSVPSIRSFPLAFDASCSSDDFSKQVIFIENNDAMTESYLMISPDGRLFQNGGDEYSYSRPITDVSLADALTDIRFDNTKFDNRYETKLTTDAVNEANAFFM